MVINNGKQLEKDMEIEYKEIPFDINRINEEGIQVVARDGRNARVICTNFNGIGEEKLIALIDCDGHEKVYQLYKNGQYYCNSKSNDDLIMFTPCKYRRMTCQELSYWLRDCPEEHREWKYEDRSPHLVKSVYEYQDNMRAYDEVGDNILIRRNGGAWEEPLIEN